MPSYDKNASFGRSGMAALASFPIPIRMYTAAWRKIADYDYLILLHGKIKARFYIFFTAHYIISYFLCKAWRQLDAMTIKHGFVELIRITMP